MIDPVGFCDGHCVICAAIIHDQNCDLVDPWNGFGQGVNGRANSFGLIETGYLDDKFSHEILGFGAVAREILIGRIR
jgi:hypothetical protein